MTSVQGQSTRRLWLCADDFALNQPVSEAIITLLGNGCLSVTSCMTDSPRWNEDGARLRDAGLGHRAGLHFNLTESFDGYAAQPLGTVMRQALMRSLDRHSLQQSIDRQLDKYEAVMGRAPAFIDGHQHVHLFPVVRDLLLDAAAKRYANRPWLRNLAPMVQPRPFAKALALQLMGAGQYGSQIASTGWPHNAAFGGLYGLTPNEDFPALMRGWLENLPQGGLIMCHPAVSAQADDVIGPARAAEFAWLMSDAWPNLLRATDVMLDTEGETPA
ncbi:MAG: ChbG/HpnK family deacetylase [Burkholderiales bacterium]|nr:ChbG/HpnK family deacetylase [Burkholderiales bacterium]